MDVPVEEKEKNKIKTFVFLDIEATGLPGDDPRILELSMMAVSREDLLCMNTSKSSPTSSNSTDRQQRNVVPQLPRVLHKYTRLFYPRKLITPKVEEITGLSNALLYRLPGFSQMSAEAISLFLELPKPLAIVAHNGDRFDFPILKAELNNVGSMEKFADLQCVDTLNAIKDIDALQQKDIEILEILEITETAKSFNFKDMDEEVSKELPVKKRARPVELEEKVNNASSASFINEPSSQAQEGNPRTLEVSPELYMTPVKDHIPAFVNNTPSTPAKLTQPPSPSVTPISSKAYTPGTPGFSPQTLRETSRVRRNLTYEGSGKRRWDGTTPYAQTNIYKRLFNAQYLAHKAESDCQALLEICGHYGDKFVNWADMHAENFDDVKPMWSKRKAFKLS